MQFSTVNKSELNSEFRIDSEYYRPENLKKEDIVLKSNYKRIDDLCDLIAGPFGSTVTAERYDPESPARYIRGKDIQNFFVDESDPVYIEEELFNDLPQFHLKEDDLLLTVVGMKFGKVAIIQSDDTPALFSCKSTLIRNCKINPWYLLAYLSCDIGYGLVRRGERGAAQPGINLFDIKSVPVPIFSEDFEKEIEKTIKLSLKFSKESKAIFQSAESDILSELGLNPWQPKHELSFTKSFSETQSIDRLDAEYFQPKYDEIVRAIKEYSGGYDKLGSLYYIKKCTEVGSGEYIESGIPFVRVSNISPFGITEEKYISEELYTSLTPDEKDVPFEKSKNHQPSKGEILFSKDGTPGIAFYLEDQPKKMIPSGGILRLKRKSDRVNDEYLTMVLNSKLVQEQVNRDVGGSIILHWRPEQVKNTIIPVFPKRIQNRIQRQAEQSFNLRNRSIALLENVKTAVQMAIEVDEANAMEWLRCTVAET